MELNKSVRDERQAGEELRNMEDLSDKETSDSDKLTNYPNQTKGKKDRSTQELLLLFDIASGSPRINYFLVDPQSPSRIFPKMNTVVFRKLRNRSWYRPVFFQGRLLILGGKDWKTGAFLSDALSYDPATSQWNSVKNMNTPRCKFTVEVLNDCIYVIGGETKKHQVTDTVERFDPTTGAWTYESPLPKPRVDHASCVQQGKIYVSGGISSLKHQCSNAFWVYDPTEKTWSEIDEGKTLLPQEREKHAMVPTGDSGIIILSGRGFENESFSEKDEEEVCQYNIGGVRCDSMIDDCVPMWDNEHPSIPQPRSNAAVAKLGENIWVVGGTSYSKGSHVKMLMYYDTGCRRWRQVYSLTEGHFSNLDCVVMQMPSTKSFLPSDRFIYERWLMW